MASLFGVIIFVLVIGVFQINLNTEGNVESRSNIIYQLVNHFNNHDIVVHNLDNNQIHLENEASFFEHLPQFSLDKYQGEMPEIIEVFYNVIFSANELIKSPNGCEFTSYTDKRDLSIVIGNDKLSADVLNVYWWAESEYNALLGRYGAKISCSTYCSKILSKIWFNKFSDTSVGYFPGFEKTIGAYNAMDAKKVEKDADILIMISNCVEERAEYVREILHHLREEIPDIIIRTCGSCFDDHPECPPRRGHTFNDQIVWIARHRYVFAFENSLCPGYVSEKLYYPLNAGSVPVIQSLFPFTDSLDVVRDRVIVSDEFVDYLKTHDYKNSWKELAFSKDEYLKASNNFFGFYPETCGYIKDCLKNVTLCEQRQIAKRDAEEEECLKSCANSFGCVPPFSEYNPRPYSGKY